MKKEQKYYKIGDVSKLFHIGMDSIRYYEKIGLLTPIYFHYTARAAFVNRTPDR